MRFRFDPLSRAFSNRCVFDENPQRIWVWTERLNASNCMRFQTKMHWCGRGRSDSYNSLVIKKSSRDKCIAHCLFSGFRVSSHLPPRWPTTFPAVFFFLPLDKRKAWKNNTNICVYKNKRISEKRWGNGKKKYWWQVSILRLPAFYLLPATLTTQARTLTAPAINSWSTVRKGRGKQTRENNKKRINGIIITVIITDLCATFR